MSAEDHAHRAAVLFACLGMDPRRQGFGTCSRHNPAAVVVAAPGGTRQRTGLMTMRRFLGFDTPPRDEPNPDVLLVTDRSTKAEIAMAITSANRSAKRQPYVIETFTTDQPTRWTRMHRRIDALLDGWERAPS